MPALAEGAAADTSFPREAASLGEDNYLIINSMGYLKEQMLKERNNIHIVNDKAPSNFRAIENKTNIALQHQS